MLAEVPDCRAAQADGGRPTFLKCLEGTTAAFAGKNMNYQIAQEQFRPGGQNGA